MPLTKAFTSIVCNELIDDKHCMHYKNELLTTKDKDYTNLTVFFLKHWGLLHCRKICCFPADTVCTVVDTYSVHVDCYLSMQLNPFHINQLAILTSGHPQEIRRSPKESPRNNTYKLSGHGFAGSFSS